MAGTVTVLQLHQRKVRCSERQALSLPKVTSSLFLAALQFLDSSIISESAWVGTRSSTWGAHGSSTRPASAAVTTNEYFRRVIVLYPRFHVSQSRQCRSNAFGRKWHFPEAHASGIEDRVADGCGNDGDCSFASAGGGHIGAIQQGDINRG